ncbi:MAG TPA: hypothetical protein ENJ00_11520 [Phycisphaerales bacterium]|nr:hypothetical protein [Phycisphaerales bacterium]
MKNHVLVACAGMAVCSADAQVRPELQQARFSGQSFHAIRATAITGLTVDGQYIYGRTIELGNGNNNTTRGTGDVCYDSAWMVDTDGDGFDDPICGDQAGSATLMFPGSRWFFGTSFSVQSISEDINDSDGVSGFNGATIDSIAFAGVFPICDGGTGSTSEVLQMVVESWDVIDNFPDIDGTDGFDPQPNGVGGTTTVVPFDTADHDGDGLVDYFVGGVVLTYANTDTDGDGVPDQLLSLGSGGYGTFFASSLCSLGVALSAGLDETTATNNETQPDIHNQDQRTDTGVSFRWTRGAIDTDGDGTPDGPLRGGFFPSTRAQFMIWGTASAAPAAAACLAASGQPDVGRGFSDGIVWAEGTNMCGDTAGDWSGGGNSPMVDERHDPSFDVSDFTGLVGAPNPLGWMFRLNCCAAPTTEDCCDINADGQCTAADFSAWIAAFNAATGRCDVNQDGACTPADFSAWIAAFNNSTAGMPDQCTFLP